MINRKLWSQFVLICLGLLVVAGVVWLFWVGRPLLNALLIAGVWAYLLDPAVRWVERRFHRKRPFSATLVYIITILVLLGLIILLGATVWKQAARWEQELQAALVQMEGWLTQPIIFFGFQFNMQPFVINLQESIDNALTRLPLGSGSILASVTNNVLWSVAVLVSLFYFLKDGPKLKPWLLGFLPEEHKSEADHLINQLDTVWTVFLRMQLLIFAILGVLFGISNFLIIWFYRLGWLSLSPLGLVVLLIVVYTAIQQVDNLWLRPRFLGRTLELHPGVVIVSLIAALALSGVMAALIIVPLFATLKIIGHYIHAKLLGLPPWPDPKGDGLLGITAV
ncbi:MAG: AI-2E family transporter [Chloroflexi bacterium]|nr:MAG: AI-2E family transporter [Chloroflexota bacterium]